MRRKGAHLRTVVRETLIQNEAIVGVTVISALPDELCVVNAVGPIEVSEIGMTEGVRGLSRLDASWSKWTGSRSRGSNRNE